MWHGMYIFEDALPGFDSHGLSNYNPEIHNPMPDCPFCRKNFTRDELFIQCRRCSRPTHKACSIKLETSLLNNFSVTCGPCIVERYNIRYKPEDDSPSNRKNTYTSSQTESQHSQCPSIETMKLLLELGAEVNGINYQQETPLHSAVKANSYEAVKNLLDAGAKISNIFYRSQKILHIAARNSRVEIVKLLIDHGAPVDEKDCIGQSPIFMAAQSGNVAVLEYLYEKRPDELAVKTFDKRTLLHRTVWHGHIEATKWLLDHYMNPNVASRSGWTPLHNAAALGRIDIAKILLRYGAKIDSKTEHLDTPYSVAKCYNRIPFMEFLQSKGAVV